MSSKCVLCGREVEDRGWQYQWNGKTGSMHQEPCGRDFHTIGYYLLDKAQETLERQGISVAQTKEKFGSMILYSAAQNDEQQKIVQALREDYQKRYPEYEWDFR